MTKLLLSNLCHTWFIDIDGTILKHNGHLGPQEKLLDGVKIFWGKIPPCDTVILVSGRAQEHKESTLSFLKREGIWYTQAIFGLPLGERILINDIKPTGLNTAFAVNTPRNYGLGDVTFECDN